MTDLPILSCDGCGACCMNVGHPMFHRSVTRDGELDALWAAVPDELKAEVNAYMASLEDHDMGQPCIWLDLETRQCKHYEYRPQQCRDFELGNEHCLRLRVQQGIDPPPQD